MSRSRIRHSWLAVCAVATLAFTGLSVPAQADDPAGAAGSSRQDPLAGESVAASSVGTLAWTKPGGTADPTDFTLAAGTLNDETSYRVGRLDDVLPKSGVQNLLIAANRDATPFCSERNPFASGVPSPNLRFCLADDDSITREWIPQAVTGVSDAKDNELWGEAADIQLFGSYDNWNPGRDDDDNGDGVKECTDGELASEDACSEKGVRVTFVQQRTNPSTGRPETKYRHVLLAWSYMNGAGHVSYDALHADDSPDDPDGQPQNGIHAGGMVWYGNYLYVADTNNGIRVFSMEKIMDLNPDGDATTNDKMGADTDGVETTANVQDKTKVGRQNNVWYSYGYRYVMPQVAAWKFTAPNLNPSSGSKCAATGRPHASYLSLDRSTVPDRLIMGEYCLPGDTPDPDYPSTGRIASYPVADLNPEAALDYVYAQDWANYLPMAKGGAQGVAAYDGTVYVNQSHSSAPGSLLRYKWSSGELVSNGSEIKTAVGPEDLYIDRGAGRLWSISEHWKDAFNTEAVEDGKTPSCTDVCQRNLYAHKLSELGG